MAPGEGSGVWVLMGQDSADDVGAKPPASQEPVLPGVLAGIGGRPGKPGLPNLPRPGVLGALQLLAHRIEFGFIDALLAQGLEDAQGPLAWCFGAYVPLYVTGVGLPVTGRQLIEHGINGRGIVAMRHQFAP